MYYFASDMHLGLGKPEESRRREKMVVRWLETIRSDAEAIFLVGDIFDFWYEYNRVVPKGFSRLLGKLSEMTDSGIEVHFFPGNHDMWAYDYLSVECGLKIHADAKVFALYEKRVFVCHGDDITSRESFWSRQMNATFRSKSARWLFSHFVHPDAALRFGQRWSSLSRKSKSLSHVFRAEKEPMVKYARAHNDHNAVDYYVFGHNHCAEIYPLTDSTAAVFLGEWIDNPTYGILSPDGRFSLKSFQ